MAHCEKYTKADTTGMFIHYERTPGRSLSNKDIDSSRSYLNYNVAETDQPLSQKKYLALRLSQIKTNNRKNQNVVCDWVVTQPKDVRQEDSHAFFLAAYEFMAERYGRKNVISAYVHMDEIGQTPHMHFCFIPVEELEDGSQKLNAKAVVDRNELRRFHPALQKAIDESLGYHVSITSGITKEQGGNKTVKQLKEETSLIQQLPTGKKKVLSSDLTYTADESAKLHALAAEGISYQIQKKDLIERQKAQEYRENYYKSSLEKVKKQEAELADLREQAEEAAARLGAPEAESYITLEQENKELRNDVDLLEDSILTIAENVGSDILQEIPLDKISFNYNNIPQKPSDSVMRVIQKYVDSALDKIKETLYVVRDMVWNAFEKIAIISKKENRPEVESIRDSLDNAITDMAESLTDDAELIMNENDYDDYMNSL